jgi:ribose-phosphate pyrophosphokinase
MLQHSKDYRVFSGNANRPLAQAICDRLARPLSRAVVGRASDGEIQVEIGENVRGADAFVLQPTCPDANQNLMELLVILDALKRSSARSLVAVIPYYGYARQDRKVAPRTPIAAKLVADLLEAAGATRVVSMDLHAGQIQGFFDVPFDHLYAMPVLLEHMRRTFGGGPEELVVVSPDAGGAERARDYSNRLGAALGIVDERHADQDPAETSIVGDVAGKVAIVVDDLVDTGDTLLQAARALVAEGASRVFAYATHAVLSGSAVSRIDASPIDQLVVTDTIPLAPGARSCSKIVQLSTAGLFAEAVKRIHQGDSLSSLFV